MSLKRRFSPYLEVARAIYENRDNLRYAWRILREGVCDGCALGTSGLRDWTMDGIHLCWIRLNLLRLNTMPPFDPAVLKHISPKWLQGGLETGAPGHGAGIPGDRDLRALGRIPCPLIRRHSESGFTPIDWETALDLIATRIRECEPSRIGFYCVSRGTVNETYYVLQKVARFVGTNNVDNSARVCHSPSTTALAQTIGYGAPTCSYRDWIGTDLLVFIGSDIANNQPVAIKYVDHAKRKGTRVAVINPYREPGMLKYWVPSSIRSAIFGTRVADAFFQICPGGDIAFINGVLKYLIAKGWTDSSFIRKHTDGWDRLCASLEAQPFEMLERLSGVTRDEMHAFASMYARARSAVFVWSMGITMHSFGTSNVKAIVNLALARGMVGRPGTGLMPIRGHSGVQGGAEVGCVPNAFPGGAKVNPENARHLSVLWGFEVPDTPGLFAPQMLEHALAGKLDVLYCIGSNFLGILPDPAMGRTALGRIPLRVHHDIVMNPQMLVEPADIVLVLPATTRYEMAGGGTETTSERRIVLNPEIPGPRVPEAREEWRVLCDIAGRVRPNDARKIFFDDTRAIRQEIARVVPFYDGIQHLKSPGDSFQWGGPRLCDGFNFPLPGGRARFSPLEPPQTTLPDGALRLTTRRGRQFNTILFSDQDVLTDSGRDSILMSVEDMKRLGIRDGQKVTLKSARGTLTGVARKASIARGLVMVHFPEANHLIGNGDYDRESGIPAYRDTIVQIESGAQ
ncbi:MAG: FdhF/YdeP family oxidoreductase [bacterium JZ-2024 1]